MRLGQRRKRGKRHRKSVAIMKKGTTSGSSKTFYTRNIGALQKRENSWSTDKQSIYSKAAGGGEGIPIEELAIKNPGLGVRKTFPPGG